MSVTLTTRPARASWLRKSALAVLVLALLLAAAGFLYENIAEARDRRFNPMPGQIVNVGGDDHLSLSMHIYCSGAGAPAVILDSGLGDSFLSWRKVQPQIATFTRVCSYDRAGIAYSTPSSQPRTSRVIADELHALLHAADVPGAYVIVGHSMGGYDVRVFASAYRSEVAGVVLVDSSHPDQEQRFPAEMRSMEGSFRREAEFLEYTMPFGIPRLLGLCEEDVDERAADCNFHSARAAVDEIIAFPESASEAAAAGTLGDLPLAVLSHDPDKLYGELPADLARPANIAWERMQEELGHLSARGTQTIAKNSGHYVQIDRPELVVEAIRNIVDQARMAQPVGVPKP
jgi:pimeloyl-ACP methyl ester carboxylesterase